MSRYYRRRYRTIVRAPRKKWASNMINVDLQGTLINEGTQQQAHYTLSAGTTLAENKTENSAPTPVVVKTGNFRGQFDLYANNNAPYSDMTIFIMYCPEGVSPTGGLALKDFMLKHPEWVIAWKKVDLDLSNGSTLNPTNTNRITISSRLKRNLNSGDRINVYLFSTIGNGASATVRMTGMVQFWTCAN